MNRCFKRKFLKEYINGNINISDENVKIIYC